MATDNDHILAIADAVSEYRPLRTQRYAAVNVLLLTWMDHDFKSGFDQETEDLKDMFRVTFGYDVWPYKIPSKDAERALNACVAQFVKSFGGEDKLIIVFYSGHGGQARETKARSPYTWAAKTCGGPTLDWSEIQPQLFLASGDVAIILDSCYAGQAARSHTSRRVELFAATDKDNYTPTGTGRWPSFTKIFIQEMKQEVSAQGLITLSSLQGRMVRAEAGLKRQPFLVTLAGDAAQGPIKLARLACDSTSAGSVPSPVSSSINSIYLRLHMFESLDNTTSSSLIRWLNQDSPASIEDIQLIDRTLSQAQDISDLGEDFFEATDDEGGAQVLSLLSNEGRAEAQRLLRDLRLALCDSGRALPATLKTTRSIMDNIEEASSRLMEFVRDSLATMDQDSLNTLYGRESTKLEGIKDRIAMRLTLLDDDGDDDDVLDGAMRVSFDDHATRDQRLRFGKKGKDDVIVEYIYYDTEDPRAVNRICHQVRRIYALLAEPKIPEFRCLEALGFSRETLCGPRFGLVHSIPERLVGRKYGILADLIGQVKNVPLDRRVRLAGLVCGAVLHLHSVGWYHKNVKSDNVVVFSIDRGGVSGDNGAVLAEEWDFESPFLIGFDCSRPVDAETRDTVDFTTTNNIYRHPDRWGRSLRFEKHHDLYSLGVLMMEIGCWRSLPSMDSKRKQFEYIRDPEDLRGLLLKAVSSKLAHAAGTRYAEAVRVCLEKRNWKTLEEWKSQKLVREKVLGPLTECARAAG